MDVVEGQAAVSLSNSQTAAAAAENTVNAPLNGTGSTFAAWNTPKHREEVDTYQKRLVNQGFNPRTCQRIFDFSIHLSLLIALLTRW